MDIKREKQVEIKVPRQRCGKTSQLVARILDWDLKETSKEIRLCSGCHMYLLERRAVTRTTRGVDSNDLVLYGKELADRPTLTRLRRRGGHLVPTEIKVMR